MFRVMYIVVGCFNNTVGRNRLETDLKVNVWKMAAILKRHSRLNSNLYYKSILLSLTSVSISSLVKKIHATIAQNLKSWLVFKAAAI